MLNEGKGTSFITHHSELITLAGPFACASGLVCDSNTPLHFITHIPFSSPNLPFFCRCDLGVFAS